MLNQVLCLLHDQLSLDIYEDDSIRHKASTYLPDIMCVWMFVNAVNNSFIAVLQDSRLWGIVVLRTRQFWRSRGFVQGWVDTIELLKVLAVRPHNETLHQLCDHCSPKEVNISHSDTAY